MTTREAIIEFITKHDDPDYPFKAGYLSSKFLDQLVEEEGTLATPIIIGGFPFTHDPKLDEDGVGIEMVRIPFGIDEKLEWRYK